MRLKTMDKPPHEMAERRLALEERALEQYMSTLRNAGYYGVFLI